MIKAIVFGFSRVLLFPVDETYEGQLNDLHTQLLESEGFDYDFFEYFLINEELIGFLRSLNKPITFFIFATDSIQDRPEVREEIDEVFSEIYRAKEIGIHKNDKEGFQILLSQLEIPANEVLFIDSKIENVNAAKEAGLHAALYVDNLQICDVISEYTK